MKVKLSFFRTLLMLMMLMAFSPISRAACIPAPDPDLNNDGIVNSADLVIVTRSNGVAKGNPRYNLNLLADTNCDGKINPTDIHYVNKAFGQTFPISSNINVTGALDGENHISFRLGNESGQTLMFTLSSGDSHTPFSVRMAQSIQPSTGLVLSPVLNGKEIFDDDGDGYIGDNIGQSITASNSGDYTITSTATVIGTGKVFTHTTHIKVYGADEPFLNVRLYIPDSSKVLQNSRSTFNVRVDTLSSDRNSVLSVRLKQLETGATMTLTPHQATNQEPGDYLGILSIDTTQADRCYHYVALAETSKGVVQSKTTQQICVTSFPLMFQEPTAEHLWQSPETKAYYANNFIIITVDDGVSEAKIREIASAMNGEVVGQSLYDSEYQIKLRDAPPVSSVNSVKGLLDKYWKIVNAHGFLQVKRLELYSKTGQVLSLSDDPFYLEGRQYYLERIRASEAWNLIGMAITPTIAIVDTGVDSQHPDIRTRLLRGKNFVSPISDPTDDTESHGTHVAGIAAAITNNGVGIAGITHSLVLPVRIGKDKTPFYKDIAKGITWAADQAALIINVSAGVPENITEQEISACKERYSNRLEPCDGQVAFQTICNAVKDASQKGAVVIAASANGGRDRKWFPAACGEGAVAIGATNIAGDDRWTAVTANAGSNFGDWVHLAAPGEDIFSLSYLDYPILIGNTFCRPFSSDFRNYLCKSGTSQAAPQVSGAVAMLLSRHPEWQVSGDSIIQTAIKRLKDTAKPLPGKGLGKGQIDIFDALFNGNFEVTKPGKEELVEWKQHTQASKSCASKTEKLGLLPVATANNKRMLVCDNTSVVSAGVMNEIDIPDGVTELPISFDWRVVAEDLTATGVNNTFIEYCDYDPYYGYYCEYYPSPRNDRVVIQLNKIDTNRKVDVAFTNLRNLISPTIPLVSASNGWLGSNWQSYSTIVPIPSAGKYQLQVRVEQSGLDINGNFPSMEGTTLFMMDRVRFRLN